MMACYWRSLRSLPVYNVFTVLHVCMFCKCRATSMTDGCLGAGRVGGSRRPNTFLLFSPQVINEYCRGICITIWIQTPKCNNSKPKICKSITPTTFNIVKETVDDEVRFHNNEWISIWILNIYLIISPFYGSIFLSISWLYFIMVCLII